MTDSKCKNILGLFYRLSKKIHWKNLKGRKKLNIIFINPCIKLNLFTKTTQT